MSAGRRSPWAAPTSTDRQRRGLDTTLAIEFDNAETRVVRRNHADWAEWKALLKAAGTRDVRVHDARHTVATLLLAQGVDQRVVMQILGHSRSNMTSRYAHVLPQVMTDAAGRIGEALWGDT